MAVYPFTPQQTISDSIIKHSSRPVFCGIGGGTTRGARTITLAKDVESQGAMAVVLNAPTSNEDLRAVAQAVEIPTVITVIRPFTDILSRIEMGASILNVAGGRETVDIVRGIRKDYPEIPIIATGGKTANSILATIEAGANAITYTPPSIQEMFKQMMDNYRHDTFYQNNKDSHLGDTWLG